MDSVIAITITLAFVLGIPGLIAGYVWLSADRKLKKLSQNSN